MATIAGHTTRAAGTVLTAAIYNTDHNIHVVNAQALNASKLEGATPPVVDGHAVVWNGTSGAAIRSAGAVPVLGARNVIAGSGLTGGGDLSADRTFAVDFATQAEAEAASTTVDVMSPLRVKQQIDLRLSNQATAEAGTDNTKLMTPLRTAQLIAVTPTGVALLNSGTLASAATLDIVLTSFTAYRGLIVELINLIPATDDTELWLRTSTDGGSSYDAAASNYLWAASYNFSNAFTILASSGADTEIEMGQTNATNGIGNGAAEGISATVKIMGQTSNVIRQRITFSGSYYVASDLQVDFVGSGRRNAAGDVNGLRFLFSSGNIASGTWALYGLS